ncbi:MAG: YcxB family protein [Bacilli bacterium]|nr:YcxB family protein [Bacilli bacterium]
MILKMTHSEEKARDFFRFHLLRRSSSKYVYFVLSTMTFLGAVVLLVLSHFYYALFSFFITIMILVIRRSTISMTINRILKKLRFPNYSYNLKFLDDKLIFITDNHQKEYLYQDLFGICETKAYVFLYISANAALIIYKYDVEAEKKLELKSFLSSKDGYRLYRFK